jgi:hypothetical protein
MNDIGISCYFLDVGQGTSQVILLGKRRAIVIDGGPDPQARVPLTLLRRFVDTIEALIVSHNDADHDTGACEILTNYQDSLRALYFLEDRPRGDPRIYQRANEINKARLNAKRPEIEIFRLETSGNRPGRIYEDSARGIVLDLVYPNFAANRRRTRPNSTSGILRLTYGTRRLVFSGDAPVAAWKWMIRAQLIEPPVVCDVMTVPHHGGGIGSERQLRWLYTKAVRCTYAIVSVGTSNHHGHPSEYGVRALRDESRAKILCTQMTSRCCDDAELLRRNWLVPDIHSQSHPSIRPDAPHVACAGTVVAEIGPDVVTIDVWRKHQDEVDRLRGMDIGHPLCRV